MIVNFLIAILMVHRGQSFEQMTPALFIMISSITLFFQVPECILLTKEDHLLYLNRRNIIVMFNKRENELVTIIGRSSRKTP